MSLLRDSLKKSKEMQKASAIISMIKKGNRDIAFKDYYNYISTFSTLSPIINGNLGFDEFKLISNKLSAYGLGWEKGYYVPIAIFSFVNPLAFVIANKDVFLNGSFNSEEFIQIAHMVQTILFNK